MRLTKKSEQKKFSKGNQLEGTLVPLEFIDEAGSQITATLFGDGIPKYADLLRVGRCYQISGGTIKAANKRYTTVKCEVALTLDAHSSITEIFDDQSIPQNAFSFTPISELCTFPVGALVDVLGITRDVSHSQAVRFRDGNENYKRMLKLYGEDGKSVEVTLWRSLAELDLREGQIIALKSIRVSEYNQSKQLSSISDTSLFFDIKDPRVERLRSWAECNPSHRPSKCLPKSFSKTMVFSYNDNQ